MAESVTLLKEKNSKSKENIPSLQLKTELYDTKDMETGNEQGKANKTADMEKSDKRTKATDKTTKEAVAKVSCNHPQNKTSGKETVKNKNTFLRKSKSCLEMTKMKEEAMPHSESFCGRPLHSYNSQVSIPESDGENTNPTTQCNISFPKTEKVKNISDKNDTTFTTADTFATSTTANIATSTSDNIATSTTTDTIVTSSTTDTIATSTSDNIATSKTTDTTVTSTTDNTATSITTAETPTTAETSQQQQPLPPLNIKKGSSEKHHESSQTLVKGFRSPFSPSKQNVCCYSEWLPQRWQGTKVDQFHDDQQSVNQSEDEETKTNISVETDLVEDRSLDVTQSEVKTAACRRDSVNISEGSKSGASSNSQSHLATSSVPPKPPPVATADFKAYVSQKTPPTFTLNDFGSGEISVLENQSVSSASPDSSASPEVDYTSMQSSSFAQFSSMQSSTTRSSQSSMTSMDSSILSTKSSSSSLQSTASPIAIISPTISTAGPSLMKEKKSDFILLHADADQEEAQQCRDHLKQDIGIHDLTVDLFSEIDSGQTAMMSLETLHDRYNKILVLGTKNLADDKFSRFLNENILTKGLQDANGKEDRVIPIWARSDCKRIITEFRIIKGFEYYHFLSDKASMSARCYVQGVRNAVKEGRKRIG